jgi:hypothetical protein
VLAKWKSLKSSTLPLLNQKLQAAHLPALDLEERPENMPQSGDED